MAGFAAALTALLILLVPRAAVAEWPFLSASAADEDEVVLHDAKLPLLKAAANPDPNPSKGGQLLALSGGSALIPASGVEGTIAEPGSSGNGSVSVYTVREGDSLSEVAEMFGVSVNTILWANDIRSASSVKPGMELVILPVSGIQHRVRSGETLASIASKYDADASDIAAYNGLDASSDLESGSELIVPGGRIAVEAPKPAPKKAAVKSPAAKKSSSSAASAGGWTNPAPGGRRTQGIHGYNGIDLAGPVGTPIYAAAAGRITVARCNDGYNGGYGNYIVISHSNGVQTLYAHLASCSVTGGSVGKGERIGSMGNTGRSTGSHLHFEVRGARNPF